MVDLALAAEAGAAFAFAADFFGEAMGEVGASSEVGSTAGAGVFALEPLPDIFVACFGAVALALDWGFGLPAFFVAGAEVDEVVAATGSFAGAVVEA